MATMKTPGVYIQEKDAFGSSVVPVPTAIPAFIGYTEKISYGGQSLLNTPVKISSLTDFTNMYGSKAPKVKFDVKLHPATSLLSAYASKGAGYAAAQVAATTAADPDAIAAADKNVANFNKMLTLLKLSEGAYELYKSYSNAALLDPITFALAAYAPPADSGTAGTDAATLTTTAEPLSAAVVAAQGDVTSAEGVLAAAQAADPVVEADVTAAEGDLATKQGLLTDAKVAALGPETEALAARLGVIADEIAGYEMKAKNFTVESDASTMGYTLDCRTVNYRLFTAINFFYANGGGDCYIISVGEYDYSKATLEATEMSEAITFLEKESEPTMIVIPDAVEVKATVSSSLAELYAGCYSIQSAMMNHCGELQNRVAILDVPGGYEEALPTAEQPVDAFREGANPSIAKYNSYGAAYYPWLHSSVLPASSINADNIHP
ncbi:MAG: hypothetical protein ACI837_003013, partial [Crocinitomicaceae bacterium]